MKCSGCGENKRDKSHEIFVGEWNPSNSEKLDAQLQAERKTLREVAQFNMRLTTFTKKTETSKPLFKNDKFGFYRKYLPLI